jgi:GNAT superfamily N-acetyltransferase
VTLPDWHLEPIAKNHRRHDFDCGDPDLNQFIHRFARQGHKQNASKTFCAVDDSDPGRILGFYTIAPASIEYPLLPSHLTRGLARHDVAGYRLARLATDLSVARQGLGRKLVASAARRCFRAASEFGGILLIIDAKNERAAQWYASFGATPVKEKALTLVMPLDSFGSEFSVDDIGEATE